MPGPTELLIIAGIVLLLFGTTKLKSLGGDLGSAIKGFRSAMTDDKKDESDALSEDEIPQLQADESKPIPEASSQEAEPVKSKSDKAP